MYDVEVLQKAVTEPRFLRELAIAIRNKEHCEIKIESGCLSIVETSRKKRFKGDKIEKSPGLAE